MQFIGLQHHQREWIFYGKTRKQPHVHKCLRGVKTNFVPLHRVTRSTTRSMSPVLWSGRFECGLVLLHVSSPMELVLSPCPTSCQDARIFEERELSSLQQRMRKLGIRPNGGIPSPREVDRRYPLDRISCHFPDLGICMGGLRLIFGVHTQV